MKETLLTLILLLTLSAKSFAALELNGYASYSKFNNEYFVGHLYLDQKTSNKKSIYSASKTKRMEIHVVTDKISPRKFNELWTTGIAVNNSNTVIEESISEIRKFTESIKGNLIPGDIIQIRYAPRSGTSISVNNIELAAHMSSELFNMLLSVWIGDVPLSSSFRDDILKGNINKKLDTPENTPPTPERRQEILSWNSSPGLISPKPDSPKPNSREPIAPKIIASASKALATEALPVKAAIVNRKIDTTALPEKVTAKEQELHIVIKAAKNNTTEKVLKKTIAKAPPKGPTTITASKKAMRANESLNRYIPALQKWVGTKVEYPLIVTESPTSQSVRFDVIIDREGKVVDINQRGSRLHSFAYNDALKVIESASPFPEIPQQIDTDLLKFKLYFQLHSRETNGEMGTYSAI